MVELLGRNELVKDYSDREISERITLYIYVCMYVYKILYDYFNRYLWLI